MLSFHVTLLKAEISALSKSVTDIGIKGLKYLQFCLRSASELQAGIKSILAVDRVKP